jgi:hypothetical protein
MSRRRMRSCPKCNEYIAITIAGPVADGGPAPVAGRCVECGYEITWQLFLGKRPTRKLAVRTFALITLIFLAAATVRCDRSLSEDSRVQWAG